MSLEEYFTGIVPGSSPGSIFSLSGNPDKIWTFILTNASFEPGSGVAAINHFVPAVSESCVGERIFQSLVNVAKANSELHVAECASESLRLEEELLEAMQKDPGNADLHDHKMQLMDDMNDQLQRAQSWERFRQRCVASSLLPMDVPGDGNCLIWSYIALGKDVFLNDDDHECLNPSSQESLALAQTIRKELQMSWGELRKFAVWQNLFKVLITDEGPATPRKRPKEKAMTSPKTPPEKASWKKQKPDVKVVETHSKAPGWKKNLPEMKLKAPPKKDRESQKDAEDAEIEVPEAQDSAVIVEHKPEGMRRVRTCKKKKLTNLQTKLKGLRRYLAHVGISYSKWQPLHWRMSGTKKAGQCKNGLWTDWLNSFVAKKENEENCEACKHLLSHYGYSQETANKWMAGLEWDDCDEQETKDDHADLVPDKAAEAAETEVKQEPEETAQDLTVEALMRTVDLYCEAEYPSFFCFLPFNLFNY